MKITKSGFAGVMAVALSLAGCAETPFDVMGGNGSQQSTQPSAAPPAATPAPPRAQAQPQVQGQPRPQQQAQVQGHLVVWRK